MLRAELRARRGAVGVVENPLQQEFQPPAPNRCWASDITSIRTRSGWRSLAVWIDLFSRPIVGWKLDARMDAPLVIEALSRALGHRLVKAHQLLIHTDRRNQYRANGYQELLLGQRGGRGFFLCLVAGTGPR